MTEPLPPEEQVPDEEALAFEMAAVAAVTGGLAAALAPVLAVALSMYAGGVTGALLAGRIREALRRVAWPAMNARLQRVAVDAVDLGVTRAVRGTSGPDRRRARGTRGPVIEVPDLDRLTNIRVLRAADLTGTLRLETKRDLNTVIGSVSSIGSRADGQVRWTANEGINAGTAAVAARLGAGLIWVTERDGCLACLAHAGWSVKPGETFPPGLTYGDKPIRPDGVPYPPLHPNCRCQVRVWKGRIGAPPASRSAVDAAARLNAEARRSVVYGWTEHESKAATLRAMSRLLSRGAGLPVSVERRARTLIQQGRTLNAPT